jgi:hypothetical protein
MPTAENNQFYELLPVLETFFNVSDPENYHALPDDWCIGMTDIVDSTAAIENNHYKRVNILGASPIVGMKNEVSEHSLPYSFGGDGCVICFPPGFEKHIRNIFTACRQIGKKEYELILRAAIIPVSHIRKKEFDVSVARFRVSDFYNQAVFTGGGLNYAETLLKSSENSPYHITDISRTVSVDFSGLECRWQEINKPEKSIISLLVQSNPDRDCPEEIYERVLIKMREIFSFDEKSNPIAASELKLSLGLSKLMSEVKFRTFGMGWLKRLRYLVEIATKNILGALFMHLGWNVQNTDWGQYKPDVVKNSDYRKFDDMLRLVISGTKEQQNELEEYLQGMFEQSALAYGLYSTPSAVITCMIFNYEQEHIHFVDGSNGGYVQAAKALKERLAALSV